MAVKIQLRGDTKANWLLTNPILSEREIVLETDTGKYKIGDGVAHYADLSYHGIDGKPSRITADGFWEIYNPATDAYDKTEYKAIGIDGKSAFELWQAIEGNADKTIVDFYVFLKGEKGDAFTFDDFTIEQLALLKGASAYQVWKAQPGNEDKTVEEYLLSIKGAPFTYADFTEDQLADLKGQDGQSAYLDAQAKGYTGTKDEFDTLLAGIGAGGASIAIIPFEITQLTGTSTQEEISAAVGGVEGLTKLTEDIRKANSAVVLKVNEEGVISLFFPITIDAALTEEPIGFAYSLLFMRGHMQFGVSYSPASNYFEAASMVIGMLSTNDFTDEDKRRLDKSLVPNDIAILTSLSALSNTKYSQKFTYTTTTAQGINFASTPAEGFECLVSIKNGTSSQITQAIPNAAAWQCEETSLVIPAGKIGFISIQYIHGIYCVRVGL